MRSHRGAGRGVAGAEGSPDAAHIGAPQVSAAASSHHLAAHARPESRPARAGASAGWRRRSPDWSRQAARRSDLPGGERTRRLDRRCRRRPPHPDRCLSVGGRPLPSPVRVWPAHVPTLLTGAHTATMPDRDATAIPQREPDHRHRWSQPHADRGLLLRPSPRLRREPGQEARMTISNHRVG
jgi:hypothetical protein